MGALGLLARGNEKANQAASLPGGLESGHSGAGGVIGCFTVRTAEFFGATAGWCLAFGTCYSYTSPTG